MCFLLHRQVSVRTCDTRSLPLGLPINSSRESRKLSAHIIIVYFYIILLQ